MNSICKALYLLLLATLISFSGCTSGGKPEVNGIGFSGFVLDYSENPIADPFLTINGKQIKVGKEGRFETVLDSADRYLVNISKMGYGSVSKVFFTGVKDKVYRLRKSTVASVNPANAISVTDNQTDCEAKVTLSEDSLKAIQKRIPVMDHRGRITGFGIPDDLFAVFKKNELREKCNTGATVNIPANALALPSGATGNVDISISTIDIFSLDGMPGDWTVEGQRQPTFMVSMGAATVDVHYEGKPVNLKKGQKAEIIIPIDPTVLETVRIIPDTIPFLVYNRKTGAWEEEGYGLFDVERKVYIAKTSHFSEFNMDIYKSDPACIRFCIDDTLESTLSSGSDKIEVIMRDDDTGSIVTKNRTYVSGGTAATESGCGDYLHLIYNLSPNAPLVLKITDNLGAIKSIKVIVTGDPIDPSNLNANNTVDPPYNACCSPGPGVCEDPCEIGTVPIMNTWSVNQPVLFGVKDDVSCVFTLNWYDPNVIGMPDQSDSYTITATSATGTTDLSSIAVTEIESGMYTASFSICAGASDLACDQNWTITVKHNFYDESSATCLPILFTGCPSCNPCP